MRLEDRVILVHGNMNEVGSSLARRLASEGASVVIADADAPAGFAVVERIESDGGQAAFVTVNHDEEDSCQALIADAIMHFGSIDGLVNTLPDLPVGDVLELEQDDWKTSLDRHLRGTWLVSRYALPFLRRGKHAAIVNIIGSDALQTQPRRLLRATTHGALSGMTRSLAIDLGPFGIRVNTVCAGFIETSDFKRHLDFSDDASAELHRIMAVHPLGRTGRPRDIANAALFLLSAEASFITGSLLTVDGGRSVVTQDLYL